MRKSLLVFFTVQFLLFSAFGQKEESLGIHIPGLKTLKKSTVISQVLNSNQKISTSEIVVLDFEGLNDMDPINEFYNGGTSGSGNTGTNYGISFTSDALAIIDSDDGGSGNFANEPSPSTIMFFVNSDPILNLPVGFGTGFSFYYCSAAEGTVKIYDDLNGTGNLLGSGTFTSNNGIGTGDPTGNFANWEPVGVSFEGVGKSIVFEGVANQCGFDDITFGSINPGQPVCPDNIVVDNDPGVCGGVVTYETPSPEDATVTQIDESGFSSGDEFPVGETIQEYEFDFGEGVKDTCSFTVTVNDTEPPEAECRDSGEEGKAAYVRNADSDPWQNGNVIGMNKVYGEGNWDDLRFSTVNPEILFSEEYSFIFIDGCSGGASAMENFINANTTQMENWVSEGGALFLNSAAGTGDDMNYGFGGFHLTHVENTSLATTNNPSHAIFNGPNLPVGTQWTGNSFAHAIISPPEQNYTSLIVNSSSQNDVLSEIKWGRGTVLFGGMTLPIFQEAGYGSGPHPEIENLHTNMLQYLRDNASNYQDIIVYLDNNGQGLLTVEDIDGGSSDNCGIESMALNQYEFNYTHLGAQDVALTVTDHAGNSSSCTTTIIVDDNIPPVAVANPIVVVLDETGQYKLTPEDLEEMAEGSTDNAIPFEHLKLTAYPRIFTCDNVGETMHVRLTVEDASGNIDRQWTTVTVLDTIPPTAVCQDMEVYLDENGEAVITAEEINKESFDACGIESMELDIALFGCDDAGENTVTLTVADPSGNTATCTAVVTVHDTFPPVFEPVADIELELEAGVFETVISYPDIVVTDNCAVEPQLTEGLGPDGLFPAGTTTETWAVTDAAGNMASLSFTVTVTAVNSPPVLVNPIADQIVNASYSLKVPVSPVLGELFDDADGDELTVEVMTEDGSAIPAWANVVNDTIVFSPLIADTGCVNIVVQATDPDGATAADTFQLCVDGYPVSAPLVNAANLEVTMYPNPTKDRVTLEINSVVSGPSEVTVFTVTGSQVLHRKFSDTQNISFSMKNHVSGMYFVKLNTNGKEVVKKLVLDKK